MRQIDLSLDRSRWGAWSELCDYYSDKISPFDVLNYLLVVSNLTSRAKPPVYILEAPSVQKRMRAFWQKRIVKKSYLYLIDILYCCHLLREFALILSQDFARYPLEAERLRIDIAKFGAYKLKLKISNEDIERCMGVEHFMHNEIWKVTNIDDFAREASYQF